MRAEPSENDGAARERVGARRVDGCRRARHFLTGEPMATIECHFCNRQIDEREAKYYRAFGGGAERDADNILQTISTVSDQPIEGSVPIGPTCLADMNAKPQAGHTLVIEKDGGRADVRKMDAAGAWA